MLKRFWMIIMFACALAGCGVEYGFDDEAESALAPLEEEELALSDLLVDGLDVWVLLDGSGTMDDDLDWVSNGIMILFREIKALRVDFSMTIFTGDPSVAGYVGPFGPNHTQQQLLQAPGLMPVNHGEFAFWAMLRWNGMYKDEFTTEGRNLLVLIITDENEQSTDMSPGPSEGISTNSFDFWLDSQAVKPGDELVDVVSVAPIDEICGEEIAERLVDLAALRQNEVIDLCEFGWPGLMDQAFNEALASQ